MMPGMPYIIKAIVTRKLESVNHFHYYLCRHLKGSGMEIIMTDSKVNTIVLTKDAYDRIKGENMRCRMLLDSILKHVEFAGEGSGDLKLDEQKILSTIEVCYPDSYKQKVSQLKRKQTIEREKAMGREV